MTLLVAALTSTLTVLLAMFSADLAAATSLRARAQLAADAAALAAVAESGPYGGGLVAELARRYARLNGARVVECLCEPGATAVQVKVSLEHVEAEARAVFDPTALAPAAQASVAGGLHPTLAAAVQRLISAAGGDVHVVSGFRSTAEQQALWAQAVQRHGSAETADDWVARPGSSMHELGLAVDLGGDLALALRLIRELALPLHRPLPNEPWHFELVGVGS